MAKDPICGMTVDEKTAVARTVYKGTTYYFCAHGCLRAFLQEPEKYLKLKEINVVREFNAAVRHPVQRDSRTETFSEIQLPKNKLL